MGTPPSNAGGSHVTEAQSSPTDVHLTFSGGLGTSGYRCGGRGGDGVRSRKCVFPPQRSVFSFNEQKFSNILRVLVRMSIKCLQTFKRSQVPVGNPAGTETPPTHNLHEELRLVLPSRVGHGDGVGALVLLHRSFDHKAAQGLPGLHPDPPLRLRHHLPPETQGERHRRGSGPARILTLSPLIQQTVGAGSPLISTSRRSLFPATTVMTFLLLAPLVSR